LFQSIYETKMEGRFVAVMEKTKLTMSWHNDNVSKELYLLSSY
jgi:hypothetical protein